MVSLSVESESLVSVTLSVTWPQWLLVVGSVSVGSTVTIVHSVGPLSGLPYNLALKHYEEIAI